MNQLMNRINFEKLSFYYPLHSIRISRFVIPIKIHIGQIDSKIKEELEIGLIGKEDEMSTEFERIKELDRAKRNFKYINIEDKLYNNFTQTFMEYHNIKYIDELLDALDSIDIYEFNKHIDEAINLMIKEFRDRLYNMLKLDEDEPKIAYKPKNEMPQDLKEYLNYTLGYIISQMGIEYNPTIFFDENIGRAIESWSLRETELHLSFLTMKNRTENLVEKWQGKIMQDNKPAK